MENTTPRTIKEKLKAFKEAQKRRDYALMQEIMAWPEFQPTFNKAEKKAQGAKLPVPSKKQIRRYRLDAVRKGILDPLELNKGDYRAYCQYIAIKARDAEFSKEVTCGQCGVGGICMHAHHIVPMKELVESKVGHLLESHKFFWCCSDCHAVFHENELVHQIIKSHKNITRTRRL
jgi:Zn-finger protein